MGIEALILLNVMIFLKSTCEKQHLISSGEDGNLQTRTLMVSTYASHLITVEVEPCLALSVSIHS